MIYFIESKLAKKSSIEVVVGTSLWIVYVGVGGGVTDNVGWMWCLRKKPGVLSRCNSPVMLVSHTTNKQSMQCMN